MYGSGEIGPLEGYRQHSSVSLNNYDSLHQPIILLPVYPAPRVDTYLCPRIIHLASGSYHRRELEPIDSRPRPGSIHHFEPLELNHQGEAVPLSNPRIYTDRGST